MALLSVQEFQSTVWKPFRCRLFGEHDYQLRREPRALLLECRRCGHRSQGWNLGAENLPRRVDAIPSAQPGVGVHRHGPATAKQPPVSQPLEPRTAEDSLRLRIGELGSGFVRVRPVARPSERWDTRAAGTLRLTFGHEDAYPMRAQIVIDSPAV